MFFEESDWVSDISAIGSTASASTVFTQPGPISAGQVVEIKLKNVLGDVGSTQKTPT